MVESLADQMVDLSRQDIFILQPTPARKKRGRKIDPQTPGFPPRERQQSPPVNSTPRKKSGGDTISFPENPRWKLFRILLEKGSNIVQESAQFRRKLKIVRKRRKPNTKWRAGRNSPLKPPFRPARIFVGRFGNFGNKCKWCTGRKNEGAVACREKREI